MRQLVLTAYFSAIAGFAAAHPSLVPHEHPHGPSLLPSLDEFVLGVLLIGVAVIAIGKFKRGRRP